MDAEFVSWLVNLLNWPLGELYCQVQNRGCRGSARQPLFSVILS